MLERSKRPARMRRMSRRVRRVGPSSSSGCMEVDLPTNDLVGFSVGTWSVWRDASLDLKRRFEDAILTEKEGKILG